ncbi:uncharacterized protein LOC134207455 [Armigeres subalbatus]|uniref:uncharacterized protein LOC134207455 n=1 Tax=Armigeres subalbatus TaxID=124917 RepID=UPI002ED23BCA
MKTNLRVAKYNRTCAVLNGTIDTLVTFDNTFTFQMKTAYSRIGNNQFNEYPMKLAEQPFCHFMNESYRTFEDKLRDSTNLPQVGPEGICSIPAGHYWFKYLRHTLDNIPSMVPEGYWRLTFLMSGPVEVSEIQVYVILSRGTFGK